MENHTSTLVSKLFLWILCFICCSLLKIQAYDSGIPNDGQLSDVQFISPLSTGASDWLHSFFVTEPIVSNAVVEKIDPKIVRESSRKRAIPQNGWNNETKLKILELHNLYRGNVTPPAGNMLFMEWDDRLENLAQLWANTCLFEHGKPPNTTYPGPYGQNLYIGTDPTGILGVWMWYEEYLNYNFHNQSCTPGEKCGHYLMMSNAENIKIGCAMTQCEFRFYTVCHYSPGAFRGIKTYDVSKPCTQCPIKPGTLCYNNLCITKDQCERNPEKCAQAKCNLKCRNCGQLNKTDCLCKCADGWDSYDCSRLCGNSHEKCGMKPGFPNKGICSFNKYAVADVYCRKMCGRCNPVMENAKVNHICCDARLCPRGYVLDLERKLCRCTILCPGPLCDVSEGGAFTVVNNIMLFFAVSLMSYLFQKNVSTF